MQVYERKAQEVRNKDIGWQRLWRSITKLHGFFLPFLPSSGSCDTAGHYVPAVSDHIFQVNKKLAPDSKIPLKGFAVGNGLTDPAIQYNAYGEDSPLLVSLSSLASSLVLT